MRAEAHGHSLPQGLLLMEAPICNDQNQLAQVVRAQSNAACPAAMPSLSQQGLQAGQQLHHGLIFDGVVLQVGTLGSAGALLMVCDSRAHMFTKGWSPIVASVREQMPFGEEIHFLKFVLCTRMQHVSAASPLCSPAGGCQHLCMQDCAAHHVCRDCTKTSPPPLNSHATGSHEGQPKQVQFCLPKQA